MVVLGLLLVILSGVLAAGVVLSNTDPVVASAFGVSLSNTSVGGLFLVGAGTGIVFALGLVLAAAGASRRRAKRRSHKQEMAAERDRHEALAEQNAALQERLEQTGSTPTPIARHAGPDETSDDFPR